LSRVFFAGAVTTVTAVAVTRAALSAFTDCVSGRASFWGELGFWALIRDHLGGEAVFDFAAKANEWLSKEKQIKKDIKEFGFAKTEIEKKGNTLFS
jgi:hypothetical protein